MHRGWWCALAIMPVSAAHPYPKAPAVIARGKCQQLRQSLHGGTVPGWKERPIGNKNKDPYRNGGPMFRVATEGSQYEQVPCSKPHGPACCGLVRVLVPRLIAPTSVRQDTHQ